MSVDYLREIGRSSSMISIVILRFNDQITIDITINKALKQTKNLTDFLFSFNLRDLLFELYLLTCFVPCAILSIGQGIEQCQMSFLCISIQYNCTKNIIINRTGFTRITMIYMDSMNHRHIVSNGSDGKRIQGASLQLSKTRRKRDWI